MMNVLALALLQTAASVGAPPATGAITGVVIDATGAPVQGAEVVLTAAATGYPMRRGSSDSVFAPSKSKGGNSLTDWWTSTTTAEGTFRFADVAPGEYGLVAQSWRPRDNEPLDPSDGTGEPAEPLAMRPAKAVDLRGTASVVVEAGTTTEAELRSQGDSEFTYERGASNDDWYLVMSLSPPSADPILGFVGWRGAFARDAIAFVRLDAGRAVIRGLPPTEIHYAVFANDSHPCFAASRFDGALKQTKTRGPRLIGGWSDGRHDPPERLVPLVATVRELHKTEGRGAVLSRLAVGREAAWAQVSESRGPSIIAALSQVDALGPLTRQVALGDGQPKHAVADLLAADAYARLAVPREPSRRR